MQSNRYDQMDGEKLTRVNAKGIFTAYRFMGRCDNEGEGKPGQALLATNVVICLHG